MSRRDATADRTRRHSGRAATADARHVRPTLAESGVSADARAFVCRGLTWRAGNHRALAPGTDALRPLQ